MAATAVTGTGQTAPLTRKAGADPLIFYGVIAGLLALVFAAAFTGAALMAALTADASAADADASAGSEARGQAAMRGLTLAAMALGALAWSWEGAGLALAGSLMLSADVVWTALVMRDPQIPPDTDEEEAARLLALRRRRLGAVRPAIGGWAVLFFLLAATFG